MKEIKTYKGNYPPPIQDETIWIDTNHFPYVTKKWTSNGWKTIDTIDTIKDYTNKNIEKASNEVLGKVINADGKLNLDLLKDANLEEWIVEKVLNDFRLMELIIKKAQITAQAVYDGTTPLLDTENPTVIKNNSIFNNINLTDGRDKSWTVPSNGAIVIQSFSILISIASVSINGARVWSSEGLAIGQNATATIRVNAGEVVTSSFTDTITFYPNK